MNNAKNPLSQQRTQLAELKKQPRSAEEASFFYTDQQFHCNAVKILPGEYFVSDENIIITTVLGSCIAVCLWDEQRKISGMNHFMLPGTQDDISGRYGSYAMELLINAMMKKGAMRSRLQAKIFGGGKVVDSLNRLNIGEKNTQFAIDYLKTEHIPIVTRDVLGPYPRRVVMLANTGKVMVKRMSANDPEKIEKQEIFGAATKIVAKTAGGSIDLF